MKRAVGASATALADRSARPPRLIPHPASNPKPSHSVSRSTHSVSHSGTKVRRSIRGIAASIQKVSRSIHSVNDSGEKVSHSGNKVSDSSGKFRLAPPSLSHFWKNCSERGSLQPRGGRGIPPGPSPRGGAISKRLIHSAPPTHLFPNPNGIAPLKS